MAVVRSFDEKTPYGAAIALGIIATFVIALDIPPLIWHIRQRNLGASSLIGWLVASNLMSLVNAYIWPNDDMSNWWHGYGLCDVEIRITAGSGLAIPGAITCIMRQLAAILDTENINISQRKDMVSWLVDLLLCFGFPVWSSIALYLVQDMRYYLVGIVGCNMSVDNSWPSLVIYYIWPLVLTIVDVYYAGVIIARIYRYRRAFGTILTARRTTRSRFVRLFLMALIIIAGILPLQVFVVIYNYSGPLQPYDWTRVHKNTWTKIVAIPSFGNVFFDRWIHAAAGFLVFLVFGVGSDARAMYRAWAIKLGVNRQFVNQGPRVRWFNHPQSIAMATNSTDSEFKTMWPRSKPPNANAGSILESQSSTVATVTNIETATPGRDASFLLP